MPSIKELKKEFLKNNRPEDGWVLYCKSRKSLGEQAFAAAVARCVHGRKHSHQFRLPNQSVLEQTGDNLRNNAARLKKCRNFDDIYDTVKSLRADGFGRVAIYDTALRIGHCVGKLPDKVYLHAGVVTGAKFFGIDPVNAGYILPSELPPELRDMPPHDVEAFLCIYKKGEYRFGGGCQPIAARAKARCAC